jgi:hypothetical protein
MSIYNYTALKSKPLKVALPIDGEIKKVKLYRIKWHGSNGRIAHEYCKLPGLASHHFYWEDYHSEVTERRWGGERPEFLISTGLLDTGDFVWEDPDSNDPGLRVYRTSKIFWQEEAIEDSLIGFLRKVGKREYEFIPK